MVLPETTNPPRRDTSAATAGRKRQALNDRIEKARTLLKQHGHIVDLDPNPCWSCRHSLRYHGPETGACYLDDCPCGMGPTAGGEQ